MHVDLPDFSMPLEKLVISENSTISPISTIIEVINYQGKFDIILFDEGFDFVKALQVFYQPKLMSLAPTEDVAQISSNY